MELNLGKISTPGYEDFMCLEEKLLYLLTR